MSIGQNMRKPRDRKWPVGSTVYVEGRPATVIRHGYSATGIYSEVRFLDGEQAEYHRSWLHGCPACGGGHPVGCCAQDGHGG